jgi:hypothetical protein
LTIQHQKRKEKEKKKEKKGAKSGTFKFSTIYFAGTITNEITGKLTRLKKNYISRRKTCIPGM